MLIDFPNMPEKTLKNFYGGEKEVQARMYADDKNRILYGRLAPGASIGMHAHETSSEIVYVVSGRGRVIYDGETFPIGPGQCHYCPKGHSHSTINDGDEDLVCITVVPEQ